MNRQINLAGLIMEEYWKQMDEKELDKFVENQYNEWFFHNDISKVEDIDEKHL